VRERIQALSPEAFTAPLPGGRSPAWLTLFGQLYHNGYHCGQIRLVRALQGL
jgi:hypothetical protein